MPGRIGAPGGRIALLGTDQCALHTDFHVIVLKPDEDDVHALFRQSAPIDLQFGGPRLADCQLIDLHHVAVDGGPADGFSEQRVRQFGLLEQAAIGG